MTNFRSKHYPRSSNGVLIMQEYAMQYYAGINILIILGVLLKLYGPYGGDSMLYFVVIGEVIALALGNLLAYGSMKRSYAELFFLKDHFSAISVYDMLFSKDKKPTAFPLIYSNAHMDPDQEKLSFTFHDQIITLRRDNWEEFDLIYNYFIAKTI
ncbi:MAG: hypothetical protein AAF696_04055 [Bacteroidota bacterium]